MTSSSGIVIPLRNIYPIPTQPNAVWTWISAARLDGSSSE